MDIKNILVLSLVLQLKGTDKLFLRAQFAVAQQIFCKQNFSIWATSKQESLSSSSTEKRERESS